MTRSTEAQQLDAATAACGDALAVLIEAVASGTQKSIDNATRAYDECRKNETERWHAYCRAASVGMA